MTQLSVLVRCRMEAYRARATSSKAELSLRRGLVLKEWKAAAELVQMSRTDEAPSAEITPSNCSRLQFWWMPRVRNEEIARKRVPSQRPLSARGGRTERGDD